MYLDLYLHLDLHLCLQDNVFTSTFVFAFVCIRLPIHVRLHFYRYVWPDTQNDFCSGTIAAHSGLRSRNVRSSWNPAARKGFNQFEHMLCNKLSDFRDKGFAEKFLLDSFKTASKYPFTTGLSQWAEDKGVYLEDTKFPFVLCLRPIDSVREKFAEFKTKKFGHIQEQLGLLTLGLVIQQLIASAQECSSWGQGKGVLKYIYRGSTCFGSGPPVLQSLNATALRSLGVTVQASQIGFPSSGMTASGPYSYTAGPMQTSTPQLPFRTPHIPANRDQKALHGATLGDLGSGHYSNI